MPRFETPRLSNNNHKTGYFNLQLYRILIKKLIFDTEKQIPDKVITVSRSSNFKLKRFAFGIY
jgi:hypothetical protein